MEGDKRKAEAFVRGLAAGSIDDALVTEDMTAWAATSGDTFPLARLRMMVGLLKTLFEGDFEMEIVETIAEGDRVAVMARSRGTLKDDGAVYANDYHYALRFRDGRICEMREYMNTAVVRDLIIPRLAAAAAAAVNKA